MNILSRVVVITSQVTLVVKNLPANAADIRDVGSILGLEYSLEKEMATYSSILVWRSPRTEEQWQATVHRVTVQFSSLHFSRSVVSNSLRPHESQHTRPPCPYQLPEFTQTRVHRVRDAIQPSHPRLSPSSPSLNPFQHQNLFQRVNSSHEVAKVLEFQL